MDTQCPKCVGQTRRKPVSGSLCIFASRKALNGNTMVIYHIHTADLFVSRIARYVSADNTS